MKSFCISGVFTCLIVIFVTICFEIRIKKNERDLLILLYRMKEVDEVLLDNQKMLTKELEKLKTSVIY